MHEKEGLQTFIQSLSGLPQWTSERILQQINQLTHYEPVIGIMGKTGAGKSSLCNALFAGEVSPVSDVAACTREPLRFRLQVGERVMTLVDLADLERMLMILDGKPVPDNRADVTRRLSDHIHENRHSTSYEDEMFTVKYFQKGTAHITFKRPELVDKLNDIIARHYPGTLASRQ